jgi:hypothetical protein
VRGAPGLRSPAARNLRGEDMKRLIEFVDNTLIHWAALRLQKRWEGKVSKGTPLVVKV